MSKDRHEQVGALFLQARELPHDRRAAFLAKACAEDEQLRAEVESLLEAEVDAPTLDYPLKQGNLTQAIPTEQRPHFGRTHRFVPGKILARRYRVVGVLGRGGMGEVFRADDIKLGQPVALKFLPSGLECDKSLRSRFMNEVRVALKVTHPNVCRVYDLGEVDDQHFISMEYIDGEDLASLLRRVGLLPGNKALQIAGEICAGLAAAHEQRILHRDLKPANIMLDGRGRVKITDFGLAVLEEAIQEADVKSGTPAYMSPEQLAGHEVTIQSDIYALGLVLYELFTGKPVFSGKTHKELALQHRDVQPEPPSNIVHDLDPVIEQVIQDCLQKKPVDRPASVHEVAEALPGADPLEAALAAGETPSPEMVAAGGEKGFVRWPVALGLLGSVFVSLLVAVLIADRVWLSARVPLPKTPQALADDAADILGQLGYSKHGAVAYGFSANYPYLHRLAPKGDRKARWGRLQSDRPPAMLFWYRQSPGALRPTNQVMPVSEINPSPLAPGMLNLVLDPQGRLLSFTSVPHTNYKAKRDGERSTGEPEWNTLFAAAGLEMADFKELTKLRWRPPVSCDRRVGWLGTPGGTNRKVQVEAAVLGNQPNAFRVFPPMLIRDRPASRRLTTSGFSIVRLALFALATAGAMLLATLQLRRGRGDRRGALRLGIFVCVVLMAFWFCIIFRLPLDTFGFQWACQRSIGFATIIALIYLGVEPFVRRRTPQLMVSWARVLGGRWRDPLVGRDVLIGIAVGVTTTVLMMASEVLIRLALDLPEPFPAYNRYVGFTERHTIGLILNNAFDATYAVFSLLALSLLMTVVLHKRWLVIAVLWAIGSFVIWRKQPEQSALSLIIVSIEYAAVFVVLCRFGLLAGIATFFATITIVFLPGTTDLLAWNGRPALIGYIVLVLLALFGLSTSLANQRHSRNRI